MLALDLGMHTGWSLWPRGQRLASGVWHLGSDRTRTRWQEFELRLMSFVQAQRVRRIAYEHVRRHAGTTAAHVFGGWLAVLQNVAMRTAATLTPLRPQDLHAAAAVALAKKSEIADREQRREENKRRMVAAAQARGWDVADDNEAEACFVGLAAVTKGGA